MEKSRKQKEITNSLPIIESPYPFNSPKAINKPKKQLVDQFESLNFLMKEQEIKCNQGKMNKYKIDFVLLDNARLMLEKETMSLEIRALNFKTTKVRKMNDELRGMIDKLRSQVEELTKQNLLLISNSAIEQGQKH